MSLFQNSVLNKYLKGLESEKVNEAYVVEYMVVTTSHLSFFVLLTWYFINVKVHCKSNLKNE